MWEGKQWLIVKQTSQISCGIHDTFQCFRKWELHCSTIIWDIYHCQPRSNWTRMSPLIWAYLLVWQNPVFIIALVRNGVFHTICSIFDTVGKLMKASGFAWALLYFEYMEVFHLRKISLFKYENWALGIHSWKKAYNVCCHKTSHQTHDPINVCQTKL